MESGMIYSRIKELRSALKMTQTEFGERLGVGRSVIANIELGRVEARTVLVRHMCEVFGVNPEWIYTGSGEMYMDGDEKVLEPLCEKYRLTAEDKRTLLAYIRMPRADRENLKRIVSGLVSSTYSPQK